MKRIRLARHVRRIGGYENFVQNFGRKIGTRDLGVDGKMLPQERDHSEPRSTWKIILK
jgi:hypothetical protein